MSGTNIIQVRLTVCSFCGVANCLSHKKYHDRCEECGRWYTKYSNYKSLQRSNPTSARQVLLDRLVDDYKILKQAGYKVPRDIQ